MEALLPWGCGQGSDSVSYWVLTRSSSGKLISMQYLSRVLLLIDLFMNNQPPVKSDLNLKNLHLMKRLN